MAAIPIDMSGIGDAFQEALNGWMATQPASVVGTWFLRGIGWAAMRWADSQAEVASGSFITELNRNLITGNPGVRAAYVAFSGIIALWISLSASYHGIRCMVSAGRSAAGETLQAIGPGMIVPVLLAVNGLPLMDFIITLANGFSRIIFYGVDGANPVTETLRQGSQMGLGEGDPNAAMGGYVLSLGLAFMFMALSRLAVHGVAAMCAITFVPAVLSMTNPPTQWIWRVWMTFASGAFLGHILQAAALRAGAGMIAESVSGQQGQVGTPGQLTALLAAIATMGMATMIPAMVGLGTAAHSFGMGSLLRRMVGRQIPQRTQEVPPQPVQTQQTNPPQTQVYSVPPSQVTVLPRVTPVRPSTSPQVVITVPAAQPALPKP
jgi:hypothetical protein